MASLDSQYRNGYWTLGLYNPSQAMYKTSWRLEVKIPKFLVVIQIFLWFTNTRYIVIKTGTNSHKMTLEKKVLLNAAE